ncbi:MAG: class I SAM-dependent methyltransferase [Steroidobacteraceae bacterium]
MSVNPEPWLQRWAASIVAAARGGPVLEIGCGTGDDTVALASMGLEVVAFDLSPEAVAAARRAAPAARISVQDLLIPSRSNVPASAS